MSSALAQAGYSYNNMEYTKTTGATGSFIEGDRLARTPKNRAISRAGVSLTQAMCQKLKLAVSRYVVEIKE